MFHTVVKWSRKGNHAHNSCNLDHIESFYFRADPIKWSFFPYTIVEWNKLDVKLQNDKSFMVFRNTLLKIARPTQNSIFKIHDLLAVKFLRRLRLGVSHLNKYRCRHNFQNCLNLLCSCSLEVESTVYFFLHCHHFNQFSQTLLDSVEKMAKDISNFTDDTFVNFPLCGSLTYSFEENTKIIKASINYS